jgi:hypothetical protein
VIKKRLKQCPFSKQAPTTIVYHSIDFTSISSAPASHLQSQFTRETHKFRYRHTLQITRRNSLTTWLYQLRSALLSLYSPQPPCTQFPQIWSYGLSVAYTLACVYLPVIGTWVGFRFWYWLSHWNDEVAPFFNRINHRVCCLINSLFRMRCPLSVITVRDDEAEENNRRGEDEVDGSANEPGVFER